MTMPKNVTVWLSFDLGIRGDYEGLYGWLDEHDAMECGDAIAVFTYPVTHDPAAEIAADLKQRVHLDKRSRLYLIYRDQTTNKNKGAFLFGGRKAPPWSGFGQTSEAKFDEEV